MAFYRIHPLALRQNFSAVRDQIRAALPCRIPCRVQACHSAAALGLKAYQMDVRNYAHHLQAVAGMAGDLCRLPRDGAESCQADRNQADQDRADQNRADQNRADQNRADQIPTCRSSVCLHPYPQAVA